MVKEFGNVRTTQAKDNVLYTFEMKEFEVVITEQEIQRSLQVP